MAKKPGPKVPTHGSDETTPALYFHCVTTYEAMLSEATSRVDDQDQEIIVWEGMFTALITSRLHMSVPYYTKISRALVAMGCIRQLRRGGGTAPSMWELITEPTEELFEHKIPKRKKTVDRYTMQQDQISAINTRLARLERALENLIEE